MHWNEMNKKQQQNLIRLALLALLGVFLLLLGGHSQPQGQSANNTDNALQEATLLQTDNTVHALEQQLARTLSCVRGAGAVTVQITVYDTGRKEYARDLQRTERKSEEERETGKQQTTELQDNQTIVQQNGQSGGALLVEEQLPKICGVLIVAEGAGQAAVQEQLLQAASTVLQLSTEKIIVLPGKGD